MRMVRNAIIEDRFPHFVHEFFTKYFKGKQLPVWAVDALQMVGIKLLQKI